MDDQTTDTARQRATEFAALLDRYFALQPATPAMCCFCGSLEDLRAAVAALEAEHEKEFSG